MIEILSQFDLSLSDVASAIWTVILIPLIAWVKTAVNSWTETKKIDKYTDMLMDAAETTVKDLYQTVVDELKGTDEWTADKQEEILSLAKTKIIVALSTDAYQVLSAANTDFDEWIASVIEAKLYDLKQSTIA